MLSLLIRPFRRALQAIVASDSPRQLAAGFALGMVLGLVPKGNLIAVSLCVLLFSLRANTGLGLVAALAFSWFGGTLDPFAEKLGTTLLSIGSLEATYATIYQLPLGPWLKFNNSVVLGTLAIGVYFFYPTYWLAEVVCRRLLPSRGAVDGCGEPHPGSQLANERRAA